MRVYVVCAFVLAACGDNVSSRGADAREDASVPDTTEPFPKMVRVFCNVEANGGPPQQPVRVTTIEGLPRTTMTDQDGRFYFDAPEGSRLIMRIEPDVVYLFPMIRGVIAEEHIRPRVFYLLTSAEVEVASQLGISFDASAAVVEVDFRNADIGGYGATLTTNGTPMQPAFGVALDDQGQPQISERTVSGGNGSTLLLGGLPVGPATFAADVPAAATLPCLPRDANPLPLEAGTVTWFDYECGLGED
jgi:hypothetical protein